MHWKVVRSALHHRGVWPYGSLALILAVAVAPAWWTFDRLVVGGDVLLIHYPWFVLWRDLLAGGVFPVWNPYSFSGLPAFATLQAGYGYPLHWLMTPVPAVPAINWLVAVHVVIAGLGAAWCAGRLRATAEGQILAGVAYALGSALTARLWAGHLSFLEANAWLPFATGFAIGIGRRHAVAGLACVVALMALAGQPEVIIFSLWWLPVWAAATADSAAIRGVLRRVTRTGLGLGLGLGLASFQLLPVLELLAFSNRQAGMSWDFKTAASLPPWHLLGMLAPTIFGGPEAYWPGQSHEWHERLVTVGAAPLLMAAFARGRWGWLCWSAVIVPTLFAFGHYLPGYGLLQVLPGYGTFRIPSKHLVLSALALALAAGCGLERFRGRRAAVIAMTAAIFLGTGSLWLSSDQLGMFSFEPDAGRVAVFAAQAIIAPALVLGLAGGLALLTTQRARRAIVVLAVVELLVVLGPYRIRPSDPELITSVFPSAGGERRVAVVGPGGAVFGNYGPVLQVVQPSGYVSLFSGRYMELVTGALNPGVALDIAPEAIPILHLLGYGLVFEPATGQAIIFDPPPLRAWVARCTWPGGVRDVREPDFPRDSCVTHAGAARRDEPQPPGAASIAEEGPGWLVVDAEGPGWLVTTEPWYPGWSATLDGHSVEADIVNGALVGVWLPANRHRVTVRYWPAGLNIGAAVSVAAALILLVAWWIDHSAVTRRTRIGAEGHRQFGRASPGQCSAETTPPDGTPKGR